MVLLLKEVIAIEVKKVVVGIALVKQKERMFIAVEFQVEALVMVIAIELFEATFVIPRMQELTKELISEVDVLIVMKEKIEVIKLVEVEVSIWVETLVVEDLTVIVHRLPTLRSNLTSLLSGVEEKVVATVRKHSAVPLVLISKTTALKGKEASDFLRRTAAVAEALVEGVVVTGEGECATLGRGVIVQEEADVNFLMAETGNVAGAKAGSKREVLKLVTRMG